MITSKINRTVAQAVVHTVILLALFMLIYPLAMALWSALKSDQAYIASKWYPTFPLRIRNVQFAFSEVYRYVLNTVFVAGVGVAGSLFIASLSSYVFARMKFPGRTLLYYAVIILMMIPGVLTLVPSYMLYREFDLLNTSAVLIIPLVVGGPIFGIFLLTAFFRGLPKDFFEAAQIDGAGDFKCYYMIAVPLCMSIMGTLTIMQVINVWNDFLWPMITIRDTDKLTISAGLIVQFTRMYSSNMPVTFAGYLIASCPLILLFIFSNKYYIQGLMSSSIKM